MALQIPFKGHGLVARARRAQIASQSNREGARSKFLNLKSLESDPIRLSQIGR